MGGGWTFDGVSPADALGLGCISGALPSHLIQRCPRLKGLGGGVRGTLHRSIIIFSESLIGS